MGRVTTAGKNGTETGPGWSDSVFVATRPGSLIQQQRSFPQERAGVCKTAGADLHVGVKARLWLWVKRYEPFFLRLESLVLAGTHL